MKEIFVWILETLVLKFRFDFSCWEWEHVMGCCEQGNESSRNFLSSFAYS
jgi:hypothetical protein